jgi:hypothetical protein
VRATSAKPPSTDVTAARGSESTGRIQLESRASSASICSLMRLAVTPQDRRQRNECHSEGMAERQAGAGQLGRSGSTPEGAWRGRELLLKPASHQLDHHARSQRIFQIRRATGRQELAFLDELESVDWDLEHG